MPMARGQWAVEPRLESAGPAEFRRGPGLAGALRVSWGPCSPLPGGGGRLVLEPGEHADPAAQAGAPGTHGAGQGPSTSSGRPFTLRHAEGQVAVAARPRAGPECLSSPRKWALGPCTGRSH